MAGRICLLAYFLGGLRISDTITIRCSIALQKRYQFESEKTEKQQGRIIVDQAREIINEFSAGKQPQDYLFPYLTTKKGDPKFEDEVEAKTALINKHLKTLAKLAKLTSVEDDLSTKYFRHSFSQHFKNSGAKPFVLRDALGHSSITMSENYEEYDNEEIDSALVHLFTTYFTKK
jgi:integrase/recombinase XerD